MSSRTGEDYIEGGAFDNFINAIKSKATQRFYTVALKRFMAFKQIDKAVDLLAWDQRMVEANVSSWIVNLKNKEDLAPATIKGYLAAVLFFTQLTT
jgi:hypothetical protein